MTAEKEGGRSHGAEPAQPGVTPSDLGELYDDEDDASENELEILDPAEVAAPPAAPDDSHPAVNPGLVDDPEEMMRLIQEASGEAVEIATEPDEEADPSSA